MNFEKWRKSVDYIARREELGEPSAKVGWNVCKNEVLKIINNTPLGYITESEHEKLEKFADLLEEKINNL